MGALVEPPSIGIACGLYRHYMLVGLAVVLVRCFDQGPSGDVAVGVGHPYVDRTWERPQTTIRTLDNWSLRRPTTGSSRNCLGTAGPHNRSHTEASLQPQR